MILYGNPTDFLIVFLGGILLSFTPCVYPLIPITVSFIGVKAGNSKLKAFILSLFYVTGMAVTYSLLGLTAAITGTLFGKISVHPITHIVVGVIIIIFGVSMLDIFYIPGFQITRLTRTKKEGRLGAFLLGLSSGLTVSPCLTPVLGTILAYIAIKKTLFYGSLLLFVFAYGMGVSLIIAGLFSSALMSIPKLGRWMSYIKRVLAAILIILGVYFIVDGIRGIV